MKKEAFVGYSENPKPYKGLSVEMTEQSNTTSPWGPAFATVGVLVSDDATGVGIADDIAIPVVMAAAVAYH